MPAFEFVVAGPPATVNSKDNNSKRYQRWIKTVREAARVRWPREQNPVDMQELTVEVTNYYRVQKDRPSPPDVDNVLKPILDAMNTVVYEDDGQVARVVSDRFDLGKPVPLKSEVTLEAVATHSEFLYIRVFWS
ncbi:RusA family crossover junction endodeoxyribonuclease [Armatimonas sp.]|uniref:RusA family crossover junction endodeoxyribonuclease n=1 Tax=Armatimonas sp. TaxID=1872638 RepID=UPI003751A68B